MGGRLRVTRESAAEAAVAKWLDALQGTPGAHLFFGAVLRKVDGRLT